MVSFFETVILYFPPLSKKRTFEACLHRRDEHATNLHQIIHNLSLTSNTYKSIDGVVKNNEEASGIGIVRAKTPQKTMINISSVLFFLNGTMMRIKLCGIRNELHRTWFLLCGNGGFVE